ncbi:hypothetical protein V1509DRAFT_652144 [Lipomyces kononenkoae]
MCLWSHLLPSVWEQTTTLTRKCFLAFIRANNSTIYRALTGPISFAFIYGYTRNLYVPNGNYGIASPAVLTSLPYVIGSDKLVYYASNGNITDVMRGIMMNATSGIPSEQKDQVNTICMQNLRGYSSCYGAVEWHSADPVAGVYNYTLRGNAGMKFIDVTKHDSDVEKYILPLQEALDAQITGDDVAINAIAFTSRTSSQHQDDVRASYADILIKYMCPVMFLLMINVIFHLVGNVAVERESGIIDLLESMGCRRVSRLLATHIAFSVVYTPGWVIGVVAVWLTTFTDTNYGLLLVYHLLIGLALVSWSIFLSSFFKKAQLSGVLSAGFSMVLCVMVVVQYATIGFNRAVTIILSFIFPPMNYTYYIQTNAKWQKEQMALNILQDAPDGGIAAGILWIAAIFQIFAFLGLAYAVEGILYRRRAPGSSVILGPTERAVELHNVRKEYKSRSLFSKNEPAVAIDSLSLNIRKGIITCLLGANGSGKTTTVEMISGIQQPTSGNIAFSDSTAGIGICPQKNVFWDALTSANLLVQCDLYPKRQASCSDLSGGQHRKLQLALMLAGGSRVCCIDEVSSGLDPISRRKIWDILLSVRGERTVILCTHYLDEADILGDDVAILSRGILKAHGTPLELKETVGTGYRVYTYSPVSGREIVHELSSGSEVAEFIQQLEQQGQKFHVCGPQLADVFMKIEAEASPEIRNLLESNVSQEYLQNKETDGEIVLAEIGSDATRQDADEAGEASGLVNQVLTMMIKRSMIALRNPIPVFLAFAIPIIVSGICSEFLKTMEPTTCDISSRIGQQYYLGYDLNPPAQVVIGSQAQFLSDSVGVLTYFNASSTESLSLTLLPGVDQLAPYIEANYTDVSAGMIIDPPTIADQVDGNNGLIYGPSIFNVLRNTRANGSLEIIANYSPFQYPWTLSLVKGLEFAAYFSMAMVALPAFVSLYPASERLRKVKALQFSNGLKPLSLWLAYTLFDFAFALATCVICIGILSSARDELFGLGYFFLVLWATSVLASFAITILYQTGIFGLYILAYFSVSTYASPDKIDSEELIVYFTMGILCPAIHMIRGIFITANIFGVLCNGGKQLDFGSIKAYGGPITYLIVQCIVYFMLLLWMDTGSIKDFRRLFTSRTKNMQAIQGPSYGDSSAIDSDVAAETERVMSGIEKHGLQLMHVDKEFYVRSGRKSVPTSVVKDVTVGVRPGECFSLLGPNGAGKTTVFNLIRGETALTSGDIYAEDLSVVKERARARQSLGVCPQFDATDLFSVEETLYIYAKLRGFASAAARNVVADMIDRVGLAAFKDHMASNLSGGNKRKLSLAIALLGNPRVILLDEPSSGLDALSKRVMWHIISRISPDKSIVLTTHSMEEADALCNRAGILSERMLAIGTSTHLRERFCGGYVVDITCASAGGSRQQEIEAPLLDWAKDRFAGIQIEERGRTGQLRLFVPTIDGFKDEKKSCSLKASDIFKILEQDKDKLGIRYSISQPSLEQVFLKIVGEHNIVEQGYDVDRSA